MKEFLDSIGALSEVLWIAYGRFCKVGFTRDQAMQLVLGMMREMVSGEGGPVDEG